MTLIYGQNEEKNWGERERASERLKPHIHSSSTLWNKFHAIHVRFVSGKNHIHGLGIIITRISNGLNKESINLLHVGIAWPNFDNSEWTNKRYFGILLFQVRFVLLVWMSSNVVGRNRNRWNRTFFCDFMPCNIRILNWGMLNEKNRRRKIRNFSHDDREYKYVIRMETNCELNKKWKSPLLCIKRV